MKLRPAHPPRLANTEMVRMPFDEPARMNRMGRSVQILGTHPRGLADYFEQRDWKRYRMLTALHDDIVAGRKRAEARGRLENALKLLAQGDRK